MTLKKMGTHFSPNGYYIFFEWVPILPLNGYPFLNYIVLYRIKYSGEIKRKEHFPFIQVNTKILTHRQQKKFW